MYRTRFIPWFFGSALVAVVAVQVFQSSNSASQSIQPYLGMGDLHRYEVNLSAPVNNPSYSGMGDVHQAETLELIPVTGGQKSSQFKPGMGDLRLFEAQNAITISGSLKSGQHYAGMGDLHLIEYRQSNSHPEEIYLTI